MPLSAQQVEHMTLAVVHQYELPVMSEQYWPAGNWFDWTFGFYLLSNNPATISFQVVQSDLYQEIHSSEIGPPERQYLLKGRNFTGNGMDRLKIGIHYGSYADVFRDMKFDVYYFDAQGQ